MSPHFRIRSGASRNIMRIQINIEVFYPRRGVQTRPNELDYLTPPYHWPIIGHDPEPVPFSEHPIFLSKSGL
jgi:hypothetical protein